MSVSGAYYICLREREGGRRRGREGGRERERERERDDREGGQREGTTAKADEAACSNVCVA